MAVMSGKTKTTVNMEVVVIRADGSKELVGVFPAWIERVGWVRRLSYRVRQILRRGR